MSFFPPAIGAVSVTQSDVRQTVNTGPVNSSGRADFLEAGTGLQVVTKDVASTPLNITFGDGFDSNGKRDVLTVVSSSLSWDDLPNNTDGISLFIRLSGTSVTTFSQTLAPNYSLVRPSSPSDGQTWYPVDHRSRMEIYESGAWNDGDLIICVGECSTDGGSVVDVRSYAYQGKATIDLGAQTFTTSFSFSHNIGVLDTRAVYYVMITSESDGYLVGDKIELLGHGRGSGSSSESWAHVRSTPVTCHLAGEGNHRVPRKSGGGVNTGNILSNLDTDFIGEFWRSF